MKRTARAFGYALFVLAAFCFSPFSRKLRHALFGRFGLTRRTREWRKSYRQRPLWFHVSSSGEFEQCLPVLDGLRERHPTLPLFVTVFSPSGHRALTLETERRLAAGKNVPWNGADYAPFDFRASAEGFLRALDPACFVAIHREMWPGVLEACARTKTPAFLFAAYFPQSAHRTFAFYRELAPFFRFIGTVEDGSAEFLRRELPGMTIEAIGDPRIERVLQRRRLRQNSTWTEGFRGHKVFIGASLWDADFRRLRPALEKVLKEFPDWRLVLVPHEPDSALVAHLENWLTSLGAKVQRWSAWRQESNCHLIVDKVGLLAELYAIADVVFVGGSFRARVHNVLEPAAYGRPILTGPYIQNSREAQEMAADSQALFAAPGAEAFEKRLLELLGDEQQRAGAARAAFDYLATRQGAAAQYIAWLERTLHLVPG